MKRWPPNRKTRQFRLATLLLVVLAIAFLCANIVPRYSTAGSTGFVVESYGFPFTCDEYTEQEMCPIAATGNIIVLCFVVFAFWHWRSDA